MQTTSVSYKCQSLHSISFFPVDDLSLPLEIDYAEHVVTQNNMEVEAANSSSPLDNSIPFYNFTLSLSQTLCTLNKKVPNFVSNSKMYTLLEPSPLMVISYSTNVLADPGLQNGNFTAIFLFGKNEFLQSDVCNMACSLQHMATFLRQKSLEGHDGNNILQMKLFGESAWSFISAIFKSGQDQLYLSSKTFIQDNVTIHFGKIKNYWGENPNPKNILIRKIPLSIPPCLSKKQLKKSKKQQEAYYNDQPHYLQMFYIWTTSLFHITSYI